MYTRCPGCHAEISFEPPANKEALGADYKHRIKCPACGATIGVKINQKPVSMASTSAVANTPVAQPVPQKQQAPTQITNVYHPPMAQVQTAKDKKAAKRATKKSGVGRNVMMMIFSFIFVALSVVGYLITTQVIDIEELPEAFAWVSDASLFDGISKWEVLIRDFEAFKSIFSDGIQVIVCNIMPMILFTLSGINFIVAFISACGKKYGRAFNLIFSMLICAAALTTFFCPYMLANAIIEELGREAITIIDYLKSIIETGEYLLLSAAIWGVLQFVFSLFFLKSLERNKKKKKNKK